MARKKPGAGPVGADKPGDLPRPARPSSPKSEKAASDPGPESESGSKSVKKTPMQKRAEKEAERAGWTEERIAEAFAAAGGTPKSSEPPETRPPGRPSKFPTIDLERVTQLAAGGLSKAEIAQAVGIAPSTGMLYQNEYPEFLEAIERGRAKEVEMVESSLHRNANGYTVPEEKVFYDSQVGRVVTHQTFRHYQPDTKAQLAILMRAETGSWRPKAEVKVSGDLNHTGEITHTINLAPLKDILNGPVAP